MLLIISKEEAFRLVTQGTIFLGFPSAHFNFHGAFIFEDCRAVVLNRSAAEPLIAAEISGGADNFLT